MSAVARGPMTNICSLLHANRQRDWNWCRLGYNPPIHYAHYLNTTILSKQQSKATTTPYIPEPRRSEGHSLSTAAICALRPQLVEAVDSEAYSLHLG
jgi:hypothetical protein